MDLVGKVLLDKTMWKRPDCCSINRNEARNKVGLDCTDRNVLPTKLLLKILCYFRNALRQLDDDVTYKNPFSLDMLLASQSQSRHKKSQQFPEWFIEAIK